MAGVRDPAFWKRFSTAVHLDEENAQRPDLKHSESWLARQQSKRNRRTRICWLFWIAFAILVAGVVIVILWLMQSGYLDHVGNQDDSSPSSVPATNGTVSAVPTASATGSASQSGVVPAATSAAAKMMQFR